MAAETSFMDLPGVLRRLQHLDVVQFHARDIETFGSEEQARSLFISNAALLHSLNYSDSVPTVT